MAGPRCHEEDRMLPRRMPLLMSRSGRDARFAWSFTWPRRRARAALAAAAAAASVVAVATFALGSLAAAAPRAGAVPAPAAAAAAAGTGYWHTSGNQILDSAGNPVRIAGINWYGVETQDEIAHGLWAQDYHTALNDIVAIAYNTVCTPFSNQNVEAPKVPHD